MATWPMAAWVEQGQDRVRFGVQVFALDGEPHPGKTVVDAGVLCDELGFDAFFIGDHPAEQSEPFIHLATIGAKTSRIRLGSVVNCVSHRHPVHLARLAADLDNLTDGRFILGLGIGWKAEEFAQLGLHFGSVPERQAMLDEAIAMIHGVFGPERFSHRGQFWSTENAQVRPLPVQSPLPLLVAGAGERTTLRQVAMHADACNFGSGRNVGKAKTPADIRRKFAILKGYCDDIGRPFESILRSHFTTWLMMGRTREAAKAKLDRHYPNGMNEDQALTRIWGDPDDVVTYFQGLADAGMQYFVVQILDAADRETMELLATDVMLRIRMKPLSL